MSLPFARSYFGGAAFQVTAAGEAGLNDSDDTSTPMSWEKLLAAAQEGDGVAYREFLKAILPFARSIARRTLNGDEAVEDAVQDSLLTLHRVRHTYRPGLSVKPWLAAIVTRRAIDIARRRGRIQAREHFDPGRYETFPDPEAKQPETGDSTLRMKQMMAELTPKQKQAIELVKLKEMSLAEASMASGQSIASLKVNVHRAIQRLRFRFGGGGE